MASPHRSEFVLVVTEVFALSGRGTIAAGRVESGTFTSGTWVDVLEDDRLVVRAKATIEFHAAQADPSSIGLLLWAVEADFVAPGQVVRVAAVSE